MRRVLAVFLFILVLPAPLAVAAASPASRRLTLSALPARQSVVRDARNTPATSAPHAGESQPVLEAIGPLRCP